MSSTHRKCRSIFQNRLMLPIAIASLFILIIYGRTLVGMLPICSKCDENRLLADRESYKLMLAYYLKQAEMRKAILRADDGVDMGTLYNVLVPEIVCPVLVRVGTVLYGGKWMCHPFRLATVPDCVIYSFGVNNEVSFEEEMVEMSGGKCRIYAYDMQQPNETTLALMDRANVVFRRVKVMTMKSIEEHGANVPKDENYIRQLMFDNGHRRAEILKIDLGSAEYGVIPELLKDVEFCQILIEIHGVWRVGNQTKITRVTKLLRQFSYYGYFLFSYEINGYYPQFCEFSFLHYSCFERYGVSIVLGKLV